MKRQDAKQANGSGDGGSASRSGKNCSCWEGETIRLKLCSYADILTYVWPKFRVYTFKNLTL